MRYDIIRKLAAVADSLDSKGYFDESTVIDNILAKMAKKAPQDFDGDGEVESSTEEWKGSRDKAIKARMGKKVKKVKKVKKQKSEE